MREYKVKRGSIHEKWLALRTPIQIFGGAFGNGKSAAIVIRLLMVMKDYPGCRALLARGSEKDLKMTTMKDFFDWCPDEWIKSYNKTDKELTLTNGSVLLFRYLHQKKDKEGNMMSNVISGNFDVIAVDQMEDPLIIEKDFNDLMGRRRGQTVYRGDDKTMPTTGPRWLLLNANPSSNWFYKRLVKPMHDHAEGRDNKKLIIDGETGKLMVGMVEGSTYDNAANLPADYIRGLEATYTGQMRDRFLLGKWASYEGQVYQEWDSSIHTIQHYAMTQFLEQLRSKTWNVRWIEGFDYGMQSPACYLAGFIDSMENVHIIDGFHEAELAPSEMRRRVYEIRQRYSIPLETTTCWADPSIFRRSPSEKQNVVGETVANIVNLGNFARGNNDIVNGITKVKSYLSPVANHINPYTAEKNAPFIYFSRDMEYIDDEMLGYRWKIDASTGEGLDVPVDKNDHALDTIKYMLGARPKITELTKYTDIPAPWEQWHSVVDEAETVNHKGSRYG